MGDSPISSPEQDKFDRWGFCQGLARAILALENPTGIVAGIYGPWGDGKTSALRLLERELGVHEGIVVVRFNPWLIQDELSLLTGFLTQLADALGKKIKKVREIVGSWLKKSGGLVPDLPGVPVSGRQIKALGEILSETKIEDLRDRVDGILAASNIRVVILIDDIDRLDAREITSIFKIVKLTANFRNAVYVLAFDDDVVAAALNERYGNREGSGRRFLEKIIQVPLQLPPADRDSLRDFALTNISSVLDRLGIELVDREQRDIVLAFDQGILPRMTTPRQVALLTNALAFALPLLRGEVNIVDLIMIESIRVLFPKAHATIRRNPDLFLGHGRTWDRDDLAEKKRTAILDSAYESLGAEERTAVYVLMERLFPALERNVIHGEKTQDKWVADKRICVDDYFKRYFTYAVPARDVRDSLIDDFLKLIPEGGGVNEQDLEAALVSLLAGRPTQLIIRKLRRAAERITSRQAARLAVLMARRGDLFPHDDSFPSFMSPAARAAIMVAKLLERTAAGEARTRLAVSVVGGAEPLDFAAECFGWMRSGDDTTTSLLTVDEDKIVGRELAARIATEAACDPPYIKYRGWIGLGLLQLGNEFAVDGSVQRFLGARLEAHPEDAVRLLVAVVPVSIGMTTGDRVFADFQRKGYEKLARLVDPAELANAVARSFGERLAQPIDRDEETPVELRAAVQFVNLHQELTKSDTATGVSP